MLSFVGLSVSATVLFLLGRCYAVYHWQNLVFSSQTVGFARMLSSVREVAAHTEAAQVDCCGLRTCCISWRRIVAGLNKKNIMSVIGRNEVWHCIRRSLPQTANMWDRKKTFFSGTDQDFEFGYTLLSMENILCRTFWFDRPLLWSARHCPAPSLLRDGCKEQGAKHTILLQKPKPRLHHSKDEGQQNGYIEMTLSSSESGHWASESHLLCWRKETEAVSSMFTTIIPAESTLLWESTAAFSPLWIQRTVNFPQLRHVSVSWVTLCPCCELQLCSPFTEEGS